MDDIIDCVRIEESAMAVVMWRDKLLTTNELVYGKEVLSLPKGHVEESETSLDAALRECYEETNVRIYASDLIRALTPFTYEFLTPSNVRIRKTLIPYLFETKDPGQPLPKEERMLSVQWMDAEEFLSSCPYENVRNIVNEALQRV